MKKNYNFRKGRRGAVEPMPPGKKRITIRLDNEIIEWFRGKVEERGGGNYQTMINSALREYINNNTETLEKMIKLAIRDELSRIIHKEDPQLFSHETAINETMRTDIPISDIVDSAVTSPNVNQDRIFYH